MQQQVQPLLSMKQLCSTYSATLRAVTTLADMLHSEFGILWQQQMQVVPGCTLCRQSQMAARGWCREAHSVRPSAARDDRWRITDQAACASRPAQPAVRPLGLWFEV